MSNALGTVFGNIAAAIRAKTGEAGTMKPADMAEKILSIPVGLATYDYTTTLGGEFSIHYSGNSPTVTAPSCVTYTDDGGEIIFTGAALGTGTITLYESDTVIGTYTVGVFADEDDVATAIDTYVNTMLAGDY